MQPPLTPSTLHLTSWTAAATARSEYVSKEVFFFKDSLEHTKVFLFCNRRFYHVNENASNRVIFELYWQQLLPFLSPHHLRSLRSRTTSHCGQDYKNTLLNRQTSQSECKWSNATQKRLETALPTPCNNSSCRCCCNTHVASRHDLNYTQLPSSLSLNCRWKGNKNPSIVKPESYDTHDFPRLNHCPSATFVY